MTDLQFYFDPVCPLAWITSKSVRTVAAQRQYRVNWRSSSLRILNAEVDCAAHFPLEREAGHALGLPSRLADALVDTSLDDEIGAETKEALGLTGRDVGTPIPHFRPQDETAFFGQAISRVPPTKTAADLWDHVVALAGFPGFVRLKRSLRECPQLIAIGAAPGLPIEKRTGMVAAAT